jgi:replicative DNA helicase
MAVARAAFTSMVTSNLAAEKAVIGALLKSEQAYWTVADKIKQEHFTDPLHQQIFGVVRDICEEGKRLSLVLLLSRLPPDHNGVMMDLLIHNYIRNAEDVTTPIDFAESIAESANMRRIEAIAHAMLKSIKKADQPAIDVAGEAELAILDVMHVSAPRRPIKEGEIAKAVVASAFRAKGGEFLPGYNTGLAAVDEVLGLIMPEDLGFICASQGDGKGQPLDAPVLTPFGYRPMGSLKVGTLVLSPDGSASTVIGVYPLGERQLYRVTFHDGTSTEVTEDHIWLAWKRGHAKYIRGSRVTGRRGSKLFTTKQMMECLGGARKPRFNIPVVAPIEFIGNRWQRPPIDPYLLGVLIGDGSLARGTIQLTSADPEIVSAVSKILKTKLIAKIDKRGNAAKTYSFLKDTKVRAGLERLGLYGKLSQDKFIPAEYFKLHMKHRWRLLQGLMDTDGWVNVNGDPRFCTASRQLADDVAWLARSLGAVVTMRTKPSHYKKGGIRHQCRDAFELRIKLANGADAFSLSRKKRLCNKPQSLYRTVTSIVPTRIAEAQCIKVSHPSSLYVTNDFIVTHNTALSMCIARHIAAQGLPVLCIQMEMSDEQIVAREMARECGMSVQEINEGAFDFAQAEAIKDAEEALQKPALYILDVDSITVRQLGAHCLAMKRTVGLAAVVVDQLDKLKSDTRHRDRFERGAEITRDLKNLFKRIKVPGIVLAQRTRTAQRRDDPTPDILDTDFPSIERDADWVLGLWREANWLRKNRPSSKDPHEIAEWQVKLDKVADRADVIGLKRRRGRAYEQRPLRWNGRLTTFEDL